MPIPWVRDYLLSDTSAGDSDGASCFFLIVKHRVDDIRGGGERLRNRVVEVLRRIRTGQQWYQAESEIYGDFATRADDAMRLIEAPPP